MNDFDDILLEPNEIDLDIDNIIQDQNSLNLNYDKLKQDINAIKDKSKIQWIYKSNCSLDKLEGNIFNGFHQLIDLDLSYNTLTYLPRGVFHQLLILQIVDLSHNLISELEDSLFKNNKHLRIINLSNNFINKINNRTFLNLPILRVLNISYNKIESLREVHFQSESLQELNLSNNLINDINAIGFWYLPNLNILYVNNNKIPYLLENMFLNMKQIKNLNFSHNMIQKLEKRTFVNLNNLKQVDFSNNLLSSCGNCFKNKPMLSELNLLNNRNLKIKDLALSENISTFKLTIHELQNLEKISNLQFLSDFELHVKTKEHFLLNSLVSIWINESLIQRLTLVIQNGIFNVYYQISNFFNLEFLHIEFLEPNDLTAIFDFGVHINRMLKLKHLALININKLIIISDSNIKHNNLHYLNLTGINNESVDFLKRNFILLENLNLSDSKIEYISRDLMSTLPYLKFLNMNGTKISVITDNLFQYNSNLEGIFFQDCQIHTIGENSFRHLKNLKQIDIRGNTQLRITQSLLNGIPKSAIVFYD